MSPQKKNQKTVKRSIILSVLFSISIILIILYFTIDEQTITYLQSASIKYEFFILAGLVNIIFWTIWGVRVKILSSAIDPSFNISVWGATKIVIANLFLEMTTPGPAGFSRFCSRSPGLAPCRVVRDKHDKDTGKGSFAIVDDSHHLNLPSDPTEGFGRVHGTKLIEEIDRKMFGKLGGHARCV